MLEERPDALAVIEIRPSAEFTIVGEIFVILIAAKEVPGKIRRNKKATRTAIAFIYDLIINSCLDNF